MAAGLVAWALAMPGLARADDVRPYAREYTGSYVSAGVFAGPTFIHPARGTGGWTTAYGGWVQATAPLSVIDARLSVHGSKRHVTLDGFGQAEMSQLSSFAGAGLHPFYLLHLESSRLFYTLGGVYVLAGLDVDRVEVHLQNDDVTDYSLGWQLGGGLDVPLDDVDDGGSFWLGVQYRYNSWTIDKKPLYDTELSQHVLFAALAYRHNGLLIVIDTP